MRGGRYHPAPVPRPRLPSRFKSPRDVPWQVIISVGMTIVREGRQRWLRLTDKERAELARLARKLQQARGRISALTEREKAELRRIVWKAAGPQQ